MNIFPLTRPVRVAAIAVTLGLATAQLAHADDMMTDLTSNPLGIAALESMDYAFNKKDFDKAMSYLSDPYIQHNPKAPDGVAAARAGMEMLAKAFPDRRVEFKRVLVDGDLVAAHSHYINAPGDLGQAVVDIFRFENGKIVEHWDVHEDVPETAANDNTMF
ncbi:nuclear transport factor 2 family protein [Phaeobacter gallaeciensis]|uniref:Nuclear transport factor 2 family protein n=1 Tax=Phaeobacter gallaeciensis TaxID=60890 RepID=A0ABD4XE85_9RHOB|nr:nuclear transport factor 2 family protein [Phaeobacter gallaeciensis]MDE4142127.1 nuclear transport factor 2 family protein [Phaeobacter gallaeciensis]MDE4146559.1 nuclear transport factor 2 family protein [Phaeobacter gallaeciensis]MDE4150632.1 nuclear transport factor 2 family protein [Phaeobacter gallaeciensis]MDE4154811.1 nuclear transport factor 2 family protein [Phaeobacter gallaeciensis]MDE4159299.1 nuclear transport factor 2 family protein [Phaeobacter gallaeciensis]